MQQENSHGFHLNIQISYRDLWLPDANHRFQLRDQELPLFLHEQAVLTRKYYWLIEIAVALQCK